MCNPIYASNCPINPATIFPVISGIWFFNNAPPLSSGTSIVCQPSWILSREVPAYRPTIEGFLLFSSGLVFALPKRRYVHKHFVRVGQMLGQYQKPDMPPIWEVDQIPCIFPKEKVFWWVIGLVKQLLLSTCRLICRIALFLITVVSRVQTNLWVPK